MANYLVTGSAGFVGSSISKRLVEQGHNVISIDNLSTGYLENIPEGVNSIIGNCADPEIYKQLRGVNLDAILHIAGQSSGEISFDNPINDIQANTESTLLLLDLCRKSNCERFLYASSMSIYGELNKTRVKETNKTKPKSFYAVGKLASEYYMDIYKDFGINTTSLRLFNIYGPGQNMINLKQGMLSIYLAQYLHHDKVLVKGSGKRFRDFIFIDDVVESFIRAINNKASFNKKINIGTGKKTTVDSLLQKISQILEINKEVSFGESTPGDLFGITANIDLMNKILGKWHHTSLDKGLKKMIDSLV